MLVSGSAVRSAQFGVPHRQGSCQRHHNWPNWPPGAKSRKSLRIVDQCAPLRFPRWVQLDVQHGDAQASDTRSTGIPVIARKARASCLRQPCSARTACRVALTRLARGGYARPGLTRTLRIDHPCASTPSRRRPSSKPVTLPRRLHSIPSFSVGKRTLALARYALASLALFTAVPAMADADDTARYHVEIDAPSSVKAAVERSLDLVRWQSYAGLTPELLSVGRVLTAHGHRSAKASEKLMKAERVIIDGKSYNLYPDRKS